MAMNKTWVVDSDDPVRWPSWQSGTYKWMTSCGAPVPGATLLRTIFQLDIMVETSVAGGLPPVGWWAGATFESRVVWTPDNIFPPFSTPRSSHLAGDLGRQVLVHDYTLPQPSDTNYYVSHWRQQWDIDTPAMRKAPTPDAVPWVWGGCFSYSLSQSLNSPSPCDILWSATLQTLWGHD